jgi:hypothetical protein
MHIYFLGPMFSSELFFAIHSHSMFFPLREKQSCIRGPFDKFVDWLQCAAFMQREALIIMPSCSGGGNVVVT